MHETAYTVDNLHQLLESNQYAPAVSDDIVDRIVEVTQARVSADGAYDDVGELDLVFGTWDNFCRDTWGSSSTDYGTEPNRFLVCRINEDVSQNRDAWLCEDADVIQQGWLTTGDGRKSKLKHVDVSDTEFVDESRVCWCPKEYLGRIALSNELLTPDGTAADAM
jgi:hypothetical protein